VLLFSDGKGELRIDDRTLFIPNDLYPLDKDVFRLYYTSRCAELQTVDIYIVDASGKVVKKTITFAGVSFKEPDDDESEETDEDEPVTPQKKLEKKLLLIFFVPLQS